MKIDLNTFLEIFYSILNNKNINSIDLLEIVEIIKIICSSDEFKIVSSRINVNDYDAEKIENHKYTSSIDEDGIVCFNVPENERVKIIKNNSIDAGYIELALNKRILVKYLEELYQGDVELKYENPNGLYNIFYYNQSDGKTESKLFTDGECIKNKLTKNEYNTLNRTVTLNNATFSIFVSYIDDIIDKIEVRGSYIGDYNILLSEIKRLLAGINDSFKVEINDNPQVYKLKVH